MHPAIQAIERRRESAGLSIREIEARAELGHSTYAKLVNGTTGEPKLPLIEAVAAAFDWPLAELLGVGTADALRLYPLQLVPSPLNPRRSADSEAIEALALSIDQHGLLQNLVVRPMTDAEAAERARSTDELGNLLPLYWIVAGERRWRALTWLESKGRWPIPALPDGRVPCRLAPAASALDPEEEHRVLALLENLQREDLSPLDAGRAFQALQQRGWSTASLAQAVHKTDRYVQQRLALLNLTPQAQEALDGETITFSQARALARANPSEQPELLERISAGDLVTEHEIDEHAKYLGRAHAGGAPTSDGKVKLSPRPAERGEGQGEGRSSAPQDEADEPAPEPTPQGPVPPIFEVNDDLRFSGSFLDTIGQAIEVLLPPEAEHGDWLHIGHPDLLPERVGLSAKGRLPGQPAAWVIWTYQAPDRLIYAGSTIPRGRCETFLRKALKLGLVVLPATTPTTYADPRDIPLPDGVADLRKQHLDELGQVTALALDSLSPFDCRMLAAEAVTLARCVCRCDANPGDAAQVALDEQLATLTRKVLAFAQRPPAPAAEPAPAPAPAPLSADDERALDIPPMLRRT